MNVNRKVAASIAWQWELCVSMSVLIVFSSAVSAPLRCCSCGRADSDTLAACLQVRG